MLKFNFHIYEFPLTSFVNTEAVSHESSSFMRAFTGFAFPCVAGFTAADGSRLTLHFRCGKERLQRRAGASCCGRRIDRLAVHDEDAHLRPCHVVADRHRDAMWHESELLNVELLLALGLGRHMMLAGAPPKSCVPPCVEKKMAFVFAPSFQSTKVAWPKWSAARAVGGGCCWRRRRRQLLAATAAAVLGGLLPKGSLARRDRGWA